VKISRKLK